MGGWMVGSVLWNYGASDGGSRVSFSGLTSCPWTSIEMTQQYLLASIDWILNSSYICFSVHSFWEFNKNSFVLCKCINLSCCLCSLLNLHTKQVWYFCFSVNRQCIFGVTLPDSSSVCSQADRHCPTASRPCAPCSLQHRHYDLNLNTTGVQCGWHSKWGLYVNSQVTQLPWLDPYIARMTQHTSYA